MSDLRIDMDNELGGAQTEGAFRALCRMQVTFKRKKGEYFAHYAFGTSITPDSDQMLRIGTLALLRLLLRCGSFRGCYARLSRADAAALRKKVADPHADSPASSSRTQATRASSRWCVRAARTAGCWTRRR